MKILFLAPHLSTGGMPAFLLKRIEALKFYTNCEIIVIEYQCLSYDYTVQRNKIIQLIGIMNFHMLKWENKCDIFTFIDHFAPDIIHIDEMSERLNPEMVKKLYNPDRKYRIIETCHDVSFDAKSKIYIPDAFALCTPYHLDTFRSINTYKEVIEFPIDNKHSSDIVREQSREFLNFFPSRYHVINVGLWTPGKNQAEGIEIARKHPKLMFHFIGNQAENFREYWEPLMKNLPDNVKIWGERDDVHLFMQAADIFMFNSTNECNPIVLKEAIGYGLPIFAHNLPQYVGIYDKYIASMNDFKYKQYNIPIDNTSQHFALNHLNLYMKTKEKPTVETTNDYKIISHFVNGPFVEITGTSDSDFRVEFWDGNKLIHQDTIKVNHWVRANRQYYTDWSILVYMNGEIVYRNNLNFLNERVYIAIDSKALGDTIAWIPYVEEFRKKHNCEVIVSTYHNNLFESVYPHIQFVSPGTTVPNIYGQYIIGYHYDNNKEPVLPNTVPLQATATNILGLEYEEIKPKIIEPSKLKVNKKYITIATNSTAGCKFWTKENWQKIIDYLVSIGYDVVNVSLEENPFKDCIVLEDKSIENTMSCINHSEFFIGLSSGLSWLAWALGKEVIMISNFTEDWYEFECYRPITWTVPTIAPYATKSVCHGCWNNKNFKFDRGDYDWCPIHKGTDRQFECQEAITPDMIIEKINIILQL